MCGWTTITDHRQGRLDALNSQIDLTQDLSSRPAHAWQYSASGNGTLEVVRTISSFFFFRFTPTHVVRSKCFYRGSLFFIVTVLYTAIRVFTDGTRETSTCYRRHPLPLPHPLPSLQLYFCDMFVSYEPCIPFTLLSIKRRPRFRKEQRQNIPALKILIGKQTADMDSTGLTSSDALSTTFLGHSAHRDPSGGSLVRGTTSLTVAGRIGMGLQSF